MNSVQTKKFKSNRSQAVRLPKNVAFPESVRDVEITAIGNKRIITPADQSWDEWKHIVRQIASISCIMQSTKLFSV